MKLKLSLLFLSLSLCCCSTHRQIMSGQETFLLYPEDEREELPEGVIKGTNGLRTLYNIGTPTLEVFVPENPNGSAMLVIPGGGFMVLSYDGEGTQVAKELNKRSITAFVLKYRTQPLYNEDGTPASGLLEVVGAFRRETEKAKEKCGKQDGGAYDWASEVPSAPLAFADAAAAMAWIREHAAQYGVKKLGMMGFSAGAITTLHQVQFHSKDTRPDIAAAIYGGWNDTFTVPEDGMPLFLCSPVKDVFTPEESLQVYLSWLKAGIPVEHHFFQAAEHGFGAGGTGHSVDAWMDLLTSYMKDVNFLK